MERLIFHPDPPFRFIGGVYIVTVLGLMSGLAGGALPRAGEDSLLLVSYWPLAINYQPIFSGQGVALASPAALGANATQECVFFRRQAQKPRALSRAAP